jgi:hypothetical protein
MIQENKELLLKDLCARSPYGVKVMTSVGGEIRNDKEQLNFAQLSLFENSYEDIKPYLFPLSSITEEQSMELFKLFGISLVDSICTDYIKINECTGITFFLNKGFDVETHLDKLIDWLNKNHFDYRGLIEKGLAIDCTNLNIY